MVKHKSYCYFPIGLARLAVNARAIIEISIISHQKSNTPFYAKLPCKYSLNMGTPNCIYIGYGMLVQYQIVIFLLYY